MIEAASHVTREGAREDLQDFLEAVDRIVAHRARDGRRRARRHQRAALRAQCDARTLHLLSRLAARARRGAADALAHAALRLRDHLLNDVMTG